MYKKDIENIKQFNFSMWELEQKNALWLVGENLNPSAWKIDSEQAVFVSH